ncbi:hypothetical protein BKA80DRAFT_283081 [Phyllosticta citrichinensis]
MVIFFPRRCFCTFLVCAWFNWWHPSEIGVLLRGDKAATNGIRAAQKQGKDTRHRH